MRKMEAQDRLPWFKLHATEYLHSTRFLSAEQFAWLTRLLCESWISGKRAALPNEIGKLAILAGARNREEFEANSSPVREFFEECDGWLYAKQLKQQATECERTSKIRSAAGKQGAATTNARFLASSRDESRGNCRGRPEKNRQRTRTERDQSQTGSRTGVGADRSLAPIPGFDAEEYFVRLCETYPKPNNSHVGMVAFNRAIESRAFGEEPDLHAIAERIVSQAELYRYAMRGREQFCPEMTAWLDKAIWDQSPAVWGDSKENKLQKEINDAFRE